MAIIVQTVNPTGLLAEIKEAIDDKRIDTWAYDKDGDFTHTPDQWKNKAWPHPSISTALNFSILGQKDVKMENAVYGVYHMAASLKCCSPISVKMHKLVSISLS